MGTPAELQTLLTNAIGYFNSHDIQNRMSCMDQEVTVYSLTGHLGYHPKHAVKAYFQQQFQDHPNFTLLTSSSLFNSGYTGAAVIGKATWKDDNRTETIIFSFTFLYKTVGGVNQWLFSSLWGS